MKGSKVFVQHILQPRSLGQEMERETTEMLPELQALLIYVEKPAAAHREQRPVKTGAWQCQADCDGGSDEG